MPERFLNSLSLRFARMRSVKVKFFAAIAAVAVVFILVITSLNLFFTRVITWRSDRIR